MTDIQALKEEDFDQATAILKLTNLYYTGIEHERVALYEAARGFWSTKRNHQLSGTKLVLVVHDWIVLEVYSVATWIQAGTTMMCFRNEKCGDSERIEFVGNIAPEKIRAKYRGKSVRNLYKKGDPSPIKCIGFEKKVR